MASCSSKASLHVMFYFLFAIYFLSFEHCCVDANSTLIVHNATTVSSKTIPIPDTFLGVFVEEINHACAGGLWAELVRNKGFEVRGPNNTLNVWSIIGNESFISVSINDSSCFERNKAALQMEVHCNDKNPCPSGGVGISNPGYWGMNIEQGKRYKVVYHIKSEGEEGDFNFQLSFTGVGVIEVSSNITQVPEDGKWRKVETEVEAKATNHYSSLQITTSKGGSYLFDQISVMPLDTYMGHGFRKDLFQMVADLKPKFMRFPGGTYVEGYHLQNKYQWKDTIGAWEERPGHNNDIWNYWSDDGIGYLEYLQLAEDLGALPIWVFNAGFSRNEQINPSDLGPYVQDALDGIEFAKGSPESKWGSVRAGLGHPKPFDLRYVAIGNEDCEFSNYQANYLKIHDAIRSAYPDIKLISNCDASVTPLKHPADLFDFHTYTTSKDLFSMSTQFDRTARSGPKAFVSEFAVWRKDAGNGSLLAAVAEAAFLIGLEKNSDIVDMVAYAPLFSNINDRKWIPDAIVFDSYQMYGTPSYWVQKLFVESSGATFLPSTLNTTSSNQLIASAISWKDSTENKNYIRIKVVNFGRGTETIDISIDGFPVGQQFGCTKTVLTSDNVMDENSFAQPTKVVPQTSSAVNVESKIQAILSPFSVTSFDFLIL
ncbi:alpha-L-arabinofuranosidase 1-like [Vigna unguiculata]|uniref:non-reducing end alpha-L-arabinofuranosidase n=1 Tax=Vigna unguiculata TaxID=3917 RepID=A0A4D6M7A2_VIGUN|nr:alpha-L-arabinofuranosidase 1-like [Vigna unguiculata]XP_027935172.1 alpha-L-arabinofuranosidase 1-like [Vigna unguiculata]QCD97115.1 alpha-N-arabinofuranosidase [Vigna unguiculata]